MKIIHASKTLCGRRETNEDALLADPEIGFFVIADGMGGYAGGEVASRITIETVSEIVTRQALDRDSTWPFRGKRGRSLSENLLAAAAKSAHRRIQKQRHGPLAQMGSTVAMLLVDGDEAAIVHVGDSRIYRCRDGHAQQLTRDHSFVAELEATGTTLPMNSHMAHMVTRALGYGGEPDTQLLKLQPGDTFVLCSDGVSDVLSIETLGALASHLCVDAACEQIVDTAYASGSRDNISAIVIQVCNEE